MKQEVVRFSNSIMRKMFVDVGTRRAALLVLRFPTNNAARCVPTFF